MKKFTLNIILALILLPSIASAIDSDNYARELYLMKNKDTLVVNRGYGDWWFGITGGAQYSMFFGELIVPEEPIIIENYNMMIQYGFGDGLGYNFGLFAEWMPRDNKWGGQLKLMFPDLMQSIAFTDPIDDTIYTRFRNEVNVTYATVSASARYNVSFLKNLFATGGLDVMLPLWYESGQRKIYDHSAQIEHDKVFEFNNFHMKFGLNAGLGYDIKVAELNRNSSIKLSPYISAHILSNTISDNGSSWYSAHVRAGFSMKWGPDDKTLDTLEHDPNYKPSPNYIAALNNSRGLNIPGNLSLLNLPIAEIAMVQYKKAEEVIKPEEPDIAELIEEEPDINVRPNNDKTFRYRNPSSTQLTRELKDYLDAIANYMQENPYSEIRVVGHSDNQGTFMENQRRSEQRTNQVIDYLMSKGIPRGRILAQSVGDRKPIADTRTEAGRRLNRRVEIRVIQ